MYAKWNMIEWEVTTPNEMKNPLWDVEVTAECTSDTGVSQTLTGYYDGTNELGEHRWIVRWTPPESGVWQCRISSVPVLPGLSKDLTLEVGKAEPGARGFVRIAQGQRWRWRFENGEPFFLLGDTIYNLFGGHYCGVDAAAVLAHRRSQGVNYIRARVHVGSNQPEFRNQWQTKDCWPWGGSPQWPDFTRFQLDYFRAMDELMAHMAAVGMGVELVLEAWMLEYPFNNRGHFLPEFEELWIRYIVSRYAAYSSLYVWCPANEYEFYPGTDTYHPEADRWFRRIARMIKSCDPYGHPVGVHQWDQTRPLHERLDDCADVDVYLIQSGWMSEYDELNRIPSLCLWIEKDLRFHAGSSVKAAVLDEFGYEKAEGCSTFPAHELFDRHHTRRGQWRAGFCGYPVTHGFNNTWGPHIRVDVDAEGSRYLPIYRRFMTEAIRFDETAPCSEVLLSFTGSEAEGTAPLAMANEDRSVIAVYFPVQGSCRLAIPPIAFRYYWFNPRTGEQSRPDVVRDASFATPEPLADADSLDSDWALVVFISAD